VVERSVHSSAHQRSSCCVFGCRARPGRHAAYERALLRLLAAAVRAGRIRAEPDRRGIPRGGPRVGSAVVVCREHSPLRAPRPMKRLLTIGHSYVVAANRRLAHELAVQGKGDWSVTAVAPERFQGDLRSISAETIDGEACALKTVPVRFDKSPHLMWYGGGVNA